MSLLATLALSSLSLTPAAVPGTGDTPLLEVLGAGTAGSNGVPTLTGTNTPLVGGAFDIVVEGGLPGAPAGLAWSTAEDLWFQTRRGNLASRVVAF